MDGLLSSAKENVIIIGVTNRIHRVDPAILRPGRLDDIVELSPPDSNQRRAIVEGLLSKMENEVTKEEIEELVIKTEGYTGADLENLCREAALQVIRETMKSKNDLVEKEAKITFKVIQSFLR
jgi:SpoVK/Ycf46/Vps4 family AAA+-type ATPase